MDSNAVAGLCRLRFRAPASAFELAVPADVALTDLMPTVMGYAGAEMEERGTDHGGWIVQRLGGDPLDEEQTCEALGLHDGDELLLRPRREALPPVHFDDLVDGVVTGMEELGGAWRPALSYRFALALALVSLVAGLGLLVLHGPHGTRVIGAVAAGVMLLVGAVSASRAMGDGVAGSMLGLAAIPYLALAGALLPHGSGNDLMTARLLAAGSGAAGAAVLALAAAAVSAPLFLSVVVAALLTIATAVLMLTGQTLEQAVAVVSVLTVLFGAFIPAVSFRLSGLRLPPLPRNADELQEEIDPFPAKDVMSRTAVADGYLTAFYASTALVCAGCMTLLASGSGWAVHALVSATSVLLLLHGRTIGSIRQRMAVQVPGVYGLLLQLALLGLSQDTGGRMLLLALLLAVTATLAVTAWSLPGRRLLPYWGRAGDILQTITAISLLPLALDVLGVYHTLRAISG